MSTIELPKRPGQGRNALQDFDNVAKSIARAWRRQQQKEGLSPQESANGVLKREAYRVICHYIEHRQAAYFETVIRERGGALSSVIKLADNPFHYGLTALFGDDGILSRPDKSVFASQMVYAYRHRVPANLLVGFIYQCGSVSELRRKLKSGATEPGFDAEYRATFPV